MTDGEGDDKGVKRAFDSELFKKRRQRLDSFRLFCIGYGPGVYM